MKILIDVNLPPSWVPVMEQVGWEARHWSTVGDLRASDQTLLSWARSNGYVVFTHDLDFGTLLAQTYADGPSVVQVRTQDVTPAHLAGLVIAALQQHEPALARGALVVIDERRARVRLLPLRLQSEP